MSPTDLDVDAVSTVLCDLDGVVWLAREPIPGASDAIARLRASGRRVLFVTNNSVSIVADQDKCLIEIDGVEFRKASPCIEAIQDHHGDAGLQI